MYPGSGSHSQARTRVKENLMSWSHGEGGRVLYPSLPLLQVDLLLH